MNLKLQVRSDHRVYTLLGRLGKSKVSPRARLVTFETDPKARKEEVTAFIDLHSKLADPRSI